MGLDTPAAARGIIDIANANLDRALRRVSVARGHDPRDFTLVAFGGAGPLHACEVAEHLEIPRVLVPRYPGVLCAFGLLVADVVLDSSRSVLGLYTAETETRLRGLLSAMLESARADLLREGVAEVDMRFSPLVDMRYQGQAYELTVPLDDDADTTLAERFHAAHAQAYGHAMPERAVEVVNLRLQAVGVTEKPLLSAEAESRAAQAVPLHIRADGMTLYEREALPPGARFDGPALAFQFDSTVFIAPGWSARVDGYRNLILEHARKEPHA
jgi:N-methylhydantoinase A